MEVNALIKNYIPTANAQQAQRFARYFALLVEWNERMNLTAITQAEQVVAKHFADSILPASLLPANARCIDVGTGAGFPGVPLLIMRPDIQMTLLDSLNKRLTFLGTLLEELGLTAQLVHLRAEDAGRASAHRARYDIALTRAVASVPALMEWTAPLLAVGGTSLMYKGPRAAQELAEAERAARLLHMDARIIAYDAEWGERHVIAAVKRAPTGKEYPRRAGSASNHPL